MRRRPVRIASLPPWLALLPCCLVTAAALARCGSWSLAIGRGQVVSARSVPKPRVPRRSSVVDVAGASPCAHVQWLKDLGMDDSQAAKTIKKAPQLIGYSIGNNLERPCSG
mmetsp:Transcript_94287/g.305090  ORF Transcript_94287/g.305090 Transcript_94287/m.305090 type:complete len:111 (+) Transcript_94287:125-457(+)